MPERKGDFPKLVKISGGRSSCPDNFYRDYKARDKCPVCPKVKKFISDVPAIPAGESVANDVLFRQRSGL